MASGTGGSHLDAKHGSKSSQNEALKSWRIKRV